MAPRRCAAGSDQTVIAVARQRDGLALERGVGGVAQVVVGVGVAQLAGLDDAVEQGGDLGATLRARAVVILAPDDDAAQGALGGVVVDGYGGVVEEQR